jgi:phage terminase large subunit-like protein
MKYKPRIVADSGYVPDITKVEPLELDDVYDEMRARFLKDNRIENLNTKQALEKFAEHLFIADRLIEKRKREYGILYYKPYNALAIEPTGLLHDPRHAFQRVKDAEGKNVPSGVFPQDLYHRSLARVRMIIAGNQCISGDTLIYAPQQGYKRVDSIEGDFSVVAWDGKKFVETLAHKPFRKEKEDLYIVELSNGNIFTCSLNHRVLMLNGGYEKILNIGDNVLFNNVTIKSKTFVKKDYLWDFEVPKYSNYLLAGIVHHNSGKTEAGAADCIKLALGIHPYIKLGSPNKGRIYGETLDKGIMEVIWPKYEAMMPIHEVRHISKYSGGQIKKVTYLNGSTDEFLSYEMPIKVSEGWTGHRVWFDEPPPKELYTACVRGLMRYEGRITITATPLSEAWLYDELFLKGKHIG